MKNINPLSNFLISNIKEAEKFKRTNLQKTINNESLVKKLEYYKNVVGIGLMPDFVNEYNKNKKNLIQINTQNIKLSWENDGFCYDFSNNQNLLEDFFIKTNAKINKMNFKNIDYFIYMNNKGEYCTWSKYGYNKKININNFFQDNNQKNFFNNVFDYSREYLSIKDKIKGLKNLDLDKKILATIKEKLYNNLYEISKALFFNYYIAIGEYKSNTNNNNTNKSFPFSINCNIDLTNSINGIIKIIPLDIPKISKQNIFINANDEILQNNYSSDELLTIDLTKLEDIYKKYGKEKTFKDEILENKEYWNSIINAFLGEDFKYDSNYTLLDKWILFEPKSEINVLYQSYQTAINYLESEKNLSDNLLKSILESKPFQINENLQNQKEDLIDIKKIDSYGYLKECHLESDYYGLNINQRIFSNKALNYFDEKAKKEKSNVIALNGPPGTGKTTVLQTVVASEIVRSVLKKSSFPIIFGCSATNQAKSNIINGFQFKEVHSSNDENNLYNRWIEYYDSDNLIMPDYGVSLSGQDIFNINSLITNLFKNKKNIKENYIKQYNRTQKSNTIFSKKQNLFFYILKDFYNIKKDDINNTLRETENIESITNELHDLLMGIYKSFKKFEEHKRNLIYKYIVDYKKLNIEHEIDLEFYKDKEEKDFIVDDIKTNLLILEHEEAKKLDKLNLLITNKNKLNNDAFLDVEREFSLFQNEIKNIVNNKNISFIKKILSSFSKKIKESNEENKLIQINNIINAAKLNITYDIYKEELEQSIKQLNLGMKNISHIKLSNEKFNYFKNKEISNLNLKIKELESECENELININLIKENIAEKETQSKNLQKIKEFLFLKNDILETIKNFKNKLPNDIMTVKRLDDLLEILNGNDALNKINKIIEELNDILSTITDNIFKPLLFHVAMRWSEGKFLLELNSFKDESYITKRSKDSVIKKYQLISKICPVFVSTMHSLLNNLTYFNQENKPLVGFIDLLIVDEAGQVSPETGAISLLLSKKALIVGDTYQIEPVYNIDEEMDKSLYENKVELIKDRDFKDIIWNCSSSSIMKMAQEFTPWKQYLELENGLYLLEHNRCPIELIDFCDKLVYKNNLIYTITSYFTENKNSVYRNELESLNPKPLDKASYNLNRNANIDKEKLYFKGQKPWGFIPNNGECLGNKRINEEEVNTILNWIDEKYDEIMSNSNEKKFNEIVAIITPFSLQAQYIRSKGANYNFNNKELNKNKNILFGYIKDSSIVIGTVHSLQGAEKAIVLFSNVYGKNNTSIIPFIDRQESIINVGVSRAKQSFYVFGNPDFFKNINNDGATKLMWEYINLYN